MTQQTWAPDALNLGAGRNKPGRRAPRRTPVPIFLYVLFLSNNICPHQTFPDWPEQTVFNFRFSIFAQHAAALCASVDFEVAELKEAEQLGITHEVTVRTLGGPSNMEG